MVIQQMYPTYTNRNRSNAKRILSAEVSWLRTTAIVIRQKLCRTIGHTFSVINGLNLVLDFSPISERYLKCKSNRLHRSYNPPIRQNRDFKLRKIGIVRQSLGIQAAHLDKVGKGLYYNGLHTINKNYGDDTLNPLLCASIC